MDMLTDLVRLVQENPSEVTHLTRTKSRIESLPLKTMLIALSQQNAPSQEIREGQADCRWFLVYIRVVDHVGEDTKVCCQQ
jgi:hypothetical protein